VASVGADQRIRPQISKEQIIDKRADTLIRPYIAQSSAKLATP
jgi:hypothetical protein